MWGGAGQPDVRDSDAALPASAIPTISYLTGLAGQNDHTLDMGFIQCPSVAITETNVNICGTNAATLNYTVSGGPTTAFSHNGVGTLSLAQLPDGTGTFTYTPGVGDVGNTVTITATIAASGACPAATDVATATVNAVPAPTATNGSVCAGGSIDLNSLVTNNGGGTLTFHSTYANAVAGTPTIGSTVSPASATNYYVRSTGVGGCYGIKEITVTIKPATCGVITITGPN